MCMFALKERIEPICSAGILKGQPAGCKKKICGEAISRRREVALLKWALLLITPETSAAIGRDQKRPRSGLQQIKI